MSTPKKSPTMASVLPTSPCAAEPAVPEGSSLEAKLTVRPVLIDTYHENVAYLHRDCAIYRAEGFKALSKIEV
ncbi:MAG: hypothetical protein ACKOWD_00125, partial [Rhodoferax sp.]